MRYWPGRSPNVNDKYRGVRPFKVISNAELDRLPRAKDPVVVRLHDIKAETEARDTDNAKTMEIVRLVAALNPMAKRKDHRRRPRIVSIETFRFYRTLKLRSPDRLKRRKK